MALAGPVDKTSDDAIIDPTFSAGPGFETLVNTPLNQAIQRATSITGSTRQPMSFFLPNSQTALNFSLNPQIVKRRKNVVEAEFPTMNAWHTYRWMEEPTMWQVAGYGGLLGPTIKDYIDALDGQDNVLWTYNYLGVRSQSVKIISTEMPYDATKGPFSFYYTITMRENNNVVINTSSDQLGVQRLSSIFTNLTYNTPIPSSTVDVYALDESKDNNLTDIALGLIQNHKSKLQKDALITSLQKLNNLRANTWAQNSYPQNQDGLEVNQLYFDKGE